MNDVTDFLKYRAEKNKVTEILSETELSKLTTLELTELVKLIGGLVQQQSELLNTLMVDLTLLVERQTEMQQQFMYVSGQAFLAVQFLKEKNIITPEELESAWDKMVKEKILEPQGLRSESNQEDLPG